MTVRWSDETRGGLWASRVFVVGSQVMEDVISGVHAQVLDRVLRQCLTLLLRCLLDQSRCNSFALLGFKFRFLSVVQKLVIMHNARL